MANTEEQEERWSEAGSEDEVAAKVVIKPNGPVVISGEFAIYDANGKRMEDRERVSICRCGRSGTMPVCDGSHNRVGFQG